MTLAYYYFLLSSIFSAIVATILGILVFLKNPKSNANKLFALFCFAFCAWAYAYIGWPLSKTAEDTLFWFQILHIGASFVSIAYLHFVIIWLRLDNKINRSILIIGYILSIFFAVNTFSPLFISDMRPIFSMRFWAVPGPLYHYYLIMFFSLFFYATYLLSVNLKRTIGINRKQIQFVLIGMVLAFLGGSTNYFLWYGINIPPYGNLFGASFVIFTAYAILKYRFMDIRLIIRRSAVFTVLVTMITAIYALIAYLITLLFQGVIGVQSAILNGIITAIFVAIGFEPLKKWLSRVTDSFLFKGSYNPQELLTEITTDISATLDLKKVLNTINQKLFNAFRATLFSIYLYDDEKGCFKEAVSIGNRSQAPRCLTAIELLKYQVVLKKYSQFQNLIVTDELKKINETNTSPQLDSIIKDLENNDISVTLPVFLHKKPIGIFFLGPKKSGDYYSREDLNVLEIVAAQSATAIENSSLYKEVNDFNKNLQKKVEEQTKDIVEKNTKLERLLKIKSEFLDIASHQLRTPVSVICGILDMFKSGTMDKLSKEKQMTFISNAFSKGQKLNAVINDILDASDLDEKELELKNSLEDLNFSTLVNNIVSYNQPEAEQKKIKISVDIAKDIMIKGDKKYLEQAVGNLVDNAVKYTQENKELSIKLSRIDKFAQLEIKDSGIGIPEKEQKILFQKFSRASNAKELHTDGSGLGLFIVKKVINAHPGAKIWFESKEGQGTTFFIQLLAI